MADVVRTTAIWNGIAGAPGYTHFHWGPGGGSVTEACDTATAAMRSFFFGLASLLPIAATINVQQECPLIDEFTGHLTDIGNSTATPAAVNGTGSGTVAAPAGASVIWLTNVLHRTHRLRGRTFLVPLASAAFEANGTLGSGAITQINTASTTLRTTSSIPFQVWGRPVSGGSDGLASNVIGHSLRDKVAVLRSRRD